MSPRNLLALIVHVLYLLRDNFLFQSSVYISAIFQVVNLVIIVLFRGMDLWKLSCNRSVTEVARPSLGYSGLYTYQRRLSRWR